MDKTKLEKLYEVKKTLESVGLKLSYEQEAQLKEAEEEMICSVVTPKLKALLDEHLIHIHGDITLTIVYKDGKFLRSDFNRGVSQSDTSSLSEIKNLEANESDYPIYKNSINTPVTNAPKEDSEFCDYTGDEIIMTDLIGGGSTVLNIPIHTRSARKILKVTMEDGRVICHNQVKDTFKTVIKLIGAERVFALGIMRCGVPIVSKVKDIKYGKAQHDIGNGWMVMTHSSTEEKRRILEEIKDSLRLKIKIEIAG